MNNIDTFIQKVNYVCPSIKGFTFQCNLDEKRKRVLIWLVNKTKKECGIVVTYQRINNNMFMLDDFVLERCQKIISIYKENKGEQLELFQERNQDAIQAESEIWG